MYAGPNRTSGLGIEGLADRKAIIACAYAVEIELRSSAVWKEPALKKYGDSSSSYISFLGCSNVGVCSSRMYALRPDLRV